MTNKLRQSILKLFLSPYKKVPKTSSQNDVESILEEFVAFNLNRVPSTNEDELLSLSEACSTSTAKSVLRSARGGVVLDDVVLDVSSDCSLGANNRVVSVSTIVMLTWLIIIY